MKDKKTLLIIGAIALLILQLKGYINLPIVRDLADMVRTVLG